MRRTNRIGIALAIVALAIGACAGCQQKLPDEDTYAGQLYVRRCGQCHAPFSPQAMTPAMWEIQVPTMEQKMTQAGLPPLAPDQKQAILEYLQSHAGHQ